MGGGVIKWAISRPVTVTVGVILVLMFGALSISGIPIQLTPDVTVPSVSVTTAWPGATPTEVESEIIEAQEEALKALPGLVRMTSEARRGQGQINLELEVGSSMEEALVRVTNLLSQVSDYPLTARQPAVTTANSTGPPMAVAVIQSSPPGRAVEEYRTWVDEVILPQLERIPGVASIRLIGGREQEVQVDFDPRKLAARGLSLGQVAAAIRTELVDISAGDMPIGKRRYVVRTQVAPPVPSELERTVLATDERGTPILLGDVATVRPGLRKRDAVGLMNGEPSMALLFFREAGSNVLEVTQDIHHAVADLQELSLAPEGLEMRIVSDQSDYITGALDQVRENLILGGALAMLVLLVFLRSVGASLVVAISIPISIVGTVLVMSLLGRTINIVSLAGMAFAVGMVVDASIVVLENIDTWRGRERDVGKASLHGAREVWGAIFASTLTTAAVFIPIIAWQDEVGELLRDVAMAVSVAVFVSLVVSVVVIPTFAAQILRARKTAAATAGVATADIPHGRAGGVVHWIARSPLRSVAVAGVGLVGAAWMGLALLPPMEYLPTGNRNIVFGIAIPPPGYSVEEMEKIAEQVQGRLVPHLGVEKDGIAALDRTFFVGSPDQAFMGGVAVDPDRVGEIANLMRGVLREVPDLIGFASQASLFGQNLGGGRSIEIDISGADLEAVAGFGGTMMGALMQAMPGAQIRPVPGLDAGAPEFQVEPIRTQAARQGISSAEIGLLIDAYVDGAIIGELGRAGEPKRDVVLRAAGIEIDSPAALEAAPAATPASREVIPVGRFAKVHERLGPTVIQHIERRRAITLQVSPPDDIALEEALDIVRNQVVGPMLAEGKVPAGVQVAYSGSAGKLEETQARFAWVLLLAVVITFLLLSALFEDFLAPIAILVTVPLAGAGGIAGLRLVDAFLGAQPLDMMTALGFVILIGVVVNNAILIVDGSLSRMREHGMELPDAVASAVRWRVRPILMSAVTTVAGLLPMVLMSGFGSELYRGIGGVVLGGLAFSTVLSLFLVPAVFTVLWRLRRGARVLISRGRARP
jgi:hydrophobic/amphiphilic exporter-1 (mainly G- bacteria), HAE1 family